MADIIEQKTDQIAVRLTDGNYLIIIGTCKAENIQNWGDLPEGSVDSGGVAVVVSGTDGTSRRVTLDNLAAYVQSAVNGQTPYVDATTKTWWCWDDSQKAYADSGVTAKGERGPRSRMARFVVGTSTAGWTADDCDYLCDGTADQVEINAAIAALPSTGGEIMILDGTYNFSANVSINKPNVTLRGCGTATRIICTAGEAIYIADNGGYCTIRDMYASSDICEAINCDSSDGHTTVLNTELHCLSDFDVITVSGTGCVVQGNRIYGSAEHGAFISGTNQIFIGNIVSGSISSSATNSVVEHNVSISTT